jgi:dUTP pyrophosphatase
MLRAYTPHAALYNINTTSRSLEDAGFDLVVPQDIIVPAKATSICINHEIQCEMVEHQFHKNGDYNSKYLSYLLYPRSSLAKTPLRMCNSVGVIDSGYRGNILAYVDNVSDKEYVIKRGDKLFQLCLPTLEYFNKCLLRDVSELSSTIRGNAGFGSTS